MLIQVESDKQLVRDMDSGAIINSDVLAYRDFMNNKWNKERKEQDILIELNTLKSSLSELREQFAAILKLNKAI